MSCQDCDAHCCAKAGAVLIIKDDINNIAKALDISFTEARNNYTHNAYDKVDGFIRYINKIEKDEYSDCVFKGRVTVDGKEFIGCTIYEYRPETCRLYSLEDCANEFGK